MHAHVKCTKPDTPAGLVKSMTMLDVVAGSVLVPGCGPSVDLDNAFIKNRVRKSNDSAAKPAETP